jgi:UDP-2,3-diacylglucosamine hydrolase
VTVLFASDVHLSPHRADRVAAFERFLAGPCRHASRLYLLGDVFDAWLGDDDARDPHPGIEAALRDLTGHGVAVYFAFGNHDFLAGEAFMQRTGCTALEQPATIRVHGTTAVALHGDQLCTRDEEYQRWRAYFTNTDNQQQFLALPFEHRLARASALKLESAERTALKAEDIMDVTPQAVNDMLDRHGATHMIHGHTHRPALHRLDNDRVRLVLGDWYEGDQVGVWDESGLRLLSASEL